MKKIKKGDWFKCIKSFNPGCSLYSSGKYYQSEQDGCITDESGSKNDVWNEEGAKRHFIKLYTIQDLKDGKVEVINDGTVKELNRVLKSAFPNCYESSGTYRFYVASGSQNGWRGSPVSLLPTQSVKDFLVQLPKEEPTHRIEFPKVGVISDPDRIRKLFDRVAKRFIENIEKEEVKQCANNAQWQPKAGEKIEADIYDNGEFVEAEYLATDERCPEWKYSVSFICPISGNREVENATKIRPIPEKQRLTKQEIADHLGIPVERLEVID